MKQIIILTCSFLLWTATAYAQVAINSDGSPPDNSAMLDVKSHNKGMLIPRMTLAEILSISNPANGLQVYNTDDKKTYVYIASENVWKELQYGNSEIDILATYTIGNGGSCAGTMVTGTYMTGHNLGPGNTVVLEVTVTVLGAWSITTNTVNGYSFSGSGIFSSIGTLQITLTGTGTPVMAQTDTFVATTSYGGGTCSFDVPVINCGSPFTDSRDGQSYSSVQIGNQCWMSENLNIGTMINGSSHQTNNGIIEKYCYNNDTNNCNTYGGLYQLDEAMQYTNTAGLQGICPDSWHIPTDDEWKTMEIYLGMTQTQADTYGWRGTDEGGKLKEAGTSHWSPPNTGANNSSGFTALPGGIYYYSNSFLYLNDVVNYWTPDQSALQNYRALTSDYQKVYRGAYPSFHAMSVRCVKN